MDPGTFIAIAGGLNLAKKGLGFMNDEAAYNERDRAARQAHKQRKREIKIANQEELARVNRTNEYIKNVWSYKMKRYEQQLAFNEEAAIRGYMGEQMNVMNQISAFMFQQSDLLNELTQQSGQLAAKGISGRAAILSEAKNTFAAYNRSRLMSAQNLSRDINAGQGAIEQITRDRYQADLDAYSEVAVQPQLEQYMPQAMPGGYKAANRNMGLRIGTALGTAAIDTAMFALGKA